VPKLQIKMGLDAISSYRRLAYTPWHAIAEFVDNATQSYFDNRKTLDKAFSSEGGDGLLVSIAYDRDGDLLRISDNAMGMSFDELEHAMHVGLRPANPIGRSKYGLGLKTAACWLGNRCEIRTKKLGEEEEHQIILDVPKIASGDGNLPYKKISDKNKELHYTVIEITKHNRRFVGRTLGKIRDYLRSMYRIDFRNGDLILEWQATRLGWDEPEFLVAVDGSEYQRPFTFKVNGRNIHGWVGILRRGSRANAGFSIINSGRVIKGWPDSWRPSSLYGQIQGSNDVVNQRLVGEIHLDGFEISHTKDDVLWMGDEEEIVEEKLLEHCGEYRTVAKEAKYRRDDERGPTEMEVKVAIDELETELGSEQLVDKIRVEIVPSEEIIEKSKDKTVEEVTSSRPETFRASFQNLDVRVFVASDLSTNDPYVISESTKDREVLVIVNTTHPHWKMLKASEGVANYLRHCVYDAIAEWQARKRSTSINPDTIKIYKDKLLRVSFEMEKNPNTPPVE